jgi:hypothetical protein
MDRPSLSRRAPLPGGCAATRFQAGPSCCPTASARTSISSWHASTAGLRGSCFPGSIRRCSPYNASASGSPRLSSRVPPAARCARSGRPDNYHLTGPALQSRGSCGQPTSNVGKNHNPLVIATTKRTVHAREDAKAGLRPKRRRVLLLATSRPRACAPQRAKSPPVPAHLQKASASGPETSRVQYMGPDRCLGLQAAANRLRLTNRAQQRPGGRLLVIDPSGSGRPSCRSGRRLASGWLQVGVEEVENPPPGVRRSVRRVTEVHG